MMTRFSIGLAALLATATMGFATSATADLEVLGSDTARAVVDATEGVVLVDLYADW